MTVFISLNNRTFCRYLSRSSRVVSPTPVSVLFCSFALGTLALSSTVTFASSNEPLKKPTFSTHFLRNGGQGVDLNDFLQGSTVAAGSYRVDIYINRSLVGRQDVSFTKQELTGQVEA